jgi:uncharacterized protein YndB with AHSA1/START domain
MFAHARRKRMPDIKHLIQIDAAPEAVHPLVATANGFTRWWASDVTEDKKTGDVELGFFNRATVYGLHPAKIAAPREAHWLCQSGKEWSGTRLLFDLTEQKGQTLLRFTHANWQAETDYMVMCTTTWGELMYRLKAAAEGKKPEPLFSKHGMAY